MYELREGAAALKASGLRRWYDWWRAGCVHDWPGANDAEGLVSFPLREGTKFVDNEVIPNPDNQFGHSGARRRREPGIQMQTSSLCLDSGSASFARVPE